MDYKKLTKPYEKEMLDNLAKFVAINSVYDDDSVNETNPFGKGVSNALKFIENLAKEDGFAVKNYNNMVVEIIAGSGEKNVTIMAHADVVPEGTGWDQDPFEMINKDEILYGRGVADDKGPLLSSYYALKALKDNNLLGNYKVRLLVGGNEERGSRCMDYYFNELKMYQPDLGFSPDSSYPLIYGEKGMLNYDVIGEFKLDNIVSIKGGVAFNSVIEKCEVVLEKDAGFAAYLKENNIDCDVSNNVYTFNGLAAHGSIPWCGKNAGMIAIKCLGDFFNIKELKELYSKFGPLKGEGIDCFYHNDEMQDTSLNVGLVEYQNGKIVLSVNYRYINACDAEELKRKTFENAKPFKINLNSVSPLLYYPQDSVLVKTLLAAYREETGDMTPPATTGGGTYAKEANNIVAFGTEFPGWDANMHSPGERIKIEHLTISMAIYARAIVELGMKLNEN